MSVSIDLESADLGEHALSDGWDDSDGELLRRKRLESEASRESRNYRFNDVRQGDIFFFK